jgi:hypothetical protein
MGLDSFIRKKLRGNDTKIGNTVLGGAKCFKASRSPEVHNQVILDDALTRMRMSPPLGMPGFTTKQYYEQFMMPIKRFLEGHQTSVVVTAMDQSEKVPKRKRATQQKRDAAAVKTSAEKKELPAYPEDAQFDWRGIYWQEGNLLKYEVFDINRVLRSRTSTRLRLIQYIRETFEAEGHDMYIPPGKAWILDAGLSDTDSKEKEKLPPLMWIGGVKGTHYLYDYVHPFGEADKALVFWAVCFLNSDPDRHIEHRTVDQDILDDALPMLHTFRVVKEEWTGLILPDGKKEMKLSEPKKATNYRWRYPDGKLPTDKECYANMSELTKVVLENKQGKEDHSTLHFNAVGWILTTLLWGSDYVDKNQVSYYKNPEDMWKLCCKNYKLLNSVKLDMDLLYKLEKPDSMVWDKSLILPEFLGEPGSGCHAPLEQFMKLLHKTDKLTKDHYLGMVDMLWQTSYCLINYNQFKQTDPVLRVMKSVHERPVDDDEIHEPPLKKQRVN